jgi:hypothetical protein
VRTWITPFALLAACGWLTAPAQSQKDPPPIVISPKKPGETANPNPPPKAPPGTIVIQPKAAPAAPVTPAAPGTPAIPTPGTTAPQNPAPAADPKDGTLLFDYWFVAAVEGRRIGYLHWTGREVMKNGMKLWQGTKYQNFTIARFGQTVGQWGEESTVETPEGEVLVTSMRQGIGRDQALALTGVVNGKTLEVRGEGMAQGANSTPWPGGVVGITREPKLFKEKALKTGESFEYLTYVPQVNRVVKTTTTLEAEETLALWPNTAPRRLMRFVSKMEPVGNFRLPPATCWCDAGTLEPLRVEFKFPGLGGRVTFLRTTEKAATEPVSDPFEIFNAQSIALERPIPGIHTKASVVYKVSIPDDDDPASVFPSDARQEVKNLDARAKTLELHVSASRGPARGVAPLPVPGKEFLGSSYFINWDNDGVKGHARRSVAGLAATASDWEKARSIERWVNQNMKAVEFSQAMATADNVARTLSGDCTEYAMLSAAMCRAVGVPSRTVLGLVYAPDHRTGKPFLAYHMWHEVFAEGQWLPLDSTLGQGGVGPGHIKITDHSWHEEKSFAPLLPVLRVLMAKPAVEVLKVNP